MPDERVIQEIENILSDVVDLGGQGERTSIVPNMLVRDASPTNLVDYIIIADNRDNDNILALRVPGVVYADNDLVNVIFPQGGEAIAFQQGSGSTTSGLWDIVTGTDDIYYNKGDVGIGKSVAPDAALEILSTSQQQLRLTFQEDTKFANFTVDTNHDLTVKPSSTGQVIFQPTTDSIDFLQVLDADGGTPILNVDSTNERVGIGTASPAVKLEIGDVTPTATSISGQSSLLAGGSSVGRLYLEGSVQADFILDDSGSGLNEKIFQLVNSGGVVKWRLINDDGSIKIDSVLTIDNTDGKIGIGSGTRDTVLDIHYSSTYTGDDWINNKEGLVVENTSNTTGNATYIVLRNTVAGANDAYWLRSIFVGNNDIDFQIGRVLTPAGDDDIRLHIDNSGFVGINGIVAPSTELDIGAGAMEFEEMTAPAAGAANTARLFAQDNGAGKTQLAVRFNTGAIQILATEP